MDLGADHHDPIGPASLDERIGQVEGVEEAAALLTDVVHGRPGQAHLVLDEAGDTGCELVRRHGCDHGGVDLFGTTAGILDGGQPRPRRRDPTS